MLEDMEGKYASDNNSDVADILIMIRWHLFSTRLPRSGENEWSDFQSSD
jgi:hypothetical protein